MSQQQDYTFILKVAVVLVVAWALLYRPESGEDEVLYEDPRAPSSASSTPKAEPPPDLIAAITEERPAEPTKEELLEELQAVEEELPAPAPTPRAVVSFSDAEPSEPSESEPLPLPPLDPPVVVSLTDDQASPSETPTAPTKVVVMNSVSSASVILEEEGTSDAEPEPSVAVVAPRRELLSLRDAARLEEIESNAQSDRERLKLEYEQKFAEAVADEKRKLEAENEKLSALYEREIGQLKQLSASEQIQLEEEIKRLRREAAKKEAALRRELSELQNAAASRNAAATVKPAPQPETYQQSITFKLNWGETCGAIDKSFLNKEFEASPGQPLYFSLEPLLPEKSYFAPMRIALPSQRVLRPSSTTVTFYTGDEPLSLALFICKDAAKDGRCLNKSRLESSSLERAAAGSSDEAFHKGDKTYVFAYALAVKDKLYLLDPTQGDTYYQRLEKALALLSVPEDDRARTLKKIRTLNTELAPSFMKYSDRHFSLTLPNKAAVACRR